MTTDSTEEIDEAKLLFDIIDSLKRKFDIDERQITTTRNLGGCVILRIHDADDFPGFGHSSVGVMEMSDEIRYGYVPRGNSLRVWTEEQKAPESR